MQIKDTRRVCVGLHLPAEVLRIARSTAVACTGAAEFDKRFSVCRIIPWDTAGAEQATGEPGEGLSVANLLRPSDGCVAQGTRRGRAKKGAHFSAYSFEAV